MNDYQRMPAIVSLALLLSGCDGRTSTIGTDATKVQSREDAAVADATSDAMRIIDAGRADSTVDGGARPPFPDGSPCAILESCCPFLPEVIQPTCLNLVAPQNGTTSDCNGGIERYVAADEMDGRPCTGTPHPTPACAVLAKCCGGWAGMQTDPNCGKIADAANQDACTQEWEHLYFDENVCYNCVGDCLDP